MKVFVTGGTGFIGSYVVNELIKHNHEVTILARNPGKVEGFLNNPKINFIKGTLSDQDSIDRGLTGQDACIHIALGGGKNAVDILENDTKRSVYIFEKAAEKNVKKIIYTSSVLAIGEYRPFMDKNSHLRPNSIYGATKAATEAYLCAIAEHYNLCTAIIRPGYVFGNPVIPGASMQPERTFIEITEKAKKNEDIRLIKADGVQFIWAGTLSQLYVDALEKDLDVKIIQAVGKEYITWETITKEIIKQTGSNSSIILEDLGWTPGACYFDAEEITKRYPCQVPITQSLCDHITYITKHY